MRYGFDRLAQIVRSRVGEDPQGGNLFVFCNRAANRMKCLWFDRNGFCLLYNQPSSHCTSCNSIRRS